jgi:hypothetical protein
MPTHSDNIPSSFVSQSGPSPRRFWDLVFWDLFLFFHPSRKAVLRPHSPVRGRPSPRRFFVSPVLGFGLLGFVSFFSPFPPPVLGFGLLGFDSFLSSFPPPVLGFGLLGFVSFFSPFVFNSAPAR